MEAKLENFKGEPNKIYRKSEKSKKKRSDNSLSNSDYSYLRIINLHQLNIELTTKQK